MDCFWQAAAAEAAASPALSPARLHCRMPTLSGVDPSAGKAEFGEAAMPCMPAGTSAMLINLLMEYYQRCQSAK